jgi:hypothetical protein
MGRLDCSVDSRCFEYIQRVRGYLVFGGNYTHDALDKGPETARAAVDA